MALAKRMVCNQTVEMPSYGWSRRIRNISLRTARFDANSVCPGIGGFATVGLWSELAHEVSAESDSGVAVIDFKTRHSVTGL